jgi:citrate lyase subunit beta / citryl-CoA lyase
MRSLLLTLGDDEAKLAAALSSGADAIVINLDLVASAKARARALTARFLKDARARSGAPALMVRVSALGEETDRDLDAVMPAAPTAIMLPRSLNGASVQRLSTKLAVREALCGLKDGGTRIIAVADTARAVLGIAAYHGSSARLIGLGWDAEPLRADIGAHRRSDAKGAYSGPCQLARDLTILAATAAGLLAIDAPFANPTDADGLRAEAFAARRDGFACKMAIDPAQTRIINEAFAA